MSRPAPEPAPVPAGVADRLPAQALFVLGAISQYVGAALAVLLFASVPAAGVAWLRVVAAAAVLVAWRRPWRTRWTAARLRLTAAFGIALALMNLAFYLAIDRLPLGTAVAIEFVGPIAVAALGSRTRRDAFALVLAVAGVLALADVHLTGSPGGFALAVGGRRDVGGVHRPRPSRGRRSADCARRTGWRWRWRSARSRSRRFSCQAPCRRSSTRCCWPPAWPSAWRRASCPTASSRSPCGGCRGPASRCCSRCCRRRRRSSARSSSGRCRALVESAGIALIVVAASLRSHADF